MGRTILDDLRFRAMDYTAQSRAVDTLSFTAQYRYHPVAVKILSAAENAAIVEDTRGNKRVILWDDMSYASETIARQNIRTWQTLKIRKWS